MRTILLLLLFVCSPAAHAQAFKCKDKAGKVEYSQVPCPSNVVDEKVVSTQGASYGGQSLETSMANDSKLTDLIIASAKAGEFEKARSLAPTPEQKTWVDKMHAQRQEQDRIAERKRNPYR